MSLTPDAEPADELISTTTSSRHPWAILTGFVALVVWLSTVLQPPGSWLILANYLSLAIACWYLCEFVCRQWIGWSASRWWYAAAIVIVLFAYGRVDYYSVRWTSVDRGFEEPAEHLQGLHGSDNALVEFPRVDYLDKRRRWTGTIYWREIWHYNPGETRMAWSQKGPMTTSNKPHGHWSLQLMSGDYRTDDLWYWYGEEVGEGEWHRLSGE